MASRHQRPQALASGDNFLKESVYRLASGEEIYQIVQTP